MDDRWSAGWLPYPRKLFRSPDRGGSPFWNKRRVFSEHEAWEYIWIRGAHTAHNYAMDGGTVLPLRAGETPPLSVRYLMKAWGWKSRKKVEAFLTTLQKLNEIRKEKRTKNGDTYLVVNCVPTSFVGDAGGTQGGRRGDKGEVREEEGKKKTTRPSRTATPYSEVFERAWGAYPKRPGNSKAAAWRAWQARLAQGCNAEEMADAAKRYRTYCDTTGVSGTNFVKMAGTFYGPDRWWELEWEIPEMNGNGNGHHAGAAAAGESSADRLRREAEAREQREASDAARRAALNTWGLEVEKRLAAASAEVRERIERAAEREVGGMRMPESGRQRALRAARLKLYGAEIGRPMPEAGS